MVEKDELDMHDTKYAVGRHIEEKVLENLYDDKNYVGKENYYDEEEKIIGTIIKGKDAPVSVSHDWLRNTPFYIAEVDKDNNKEHIECHLDDLPEEFVYKK